MEFYCNQINPILGNWLLINRPLLKFSNHKGWPISIFFRIQSLGTVEHANNVTSFER